jgi:hypothetical protein
VKTITTICAIERDGVQMLTDDEAAVIEALIATGKAGFIDATDPETLSGIDWRQWSGYQRQTIERLTSQLHKRPRATKITKLEQAIIVKARRPELSAADVANLLECSPSLLSNERYTDAAQRIEQEARRRSVSGKPVPKRRRSKKPKKLNS